MPHEGARGLGAPHARRHVRLRRSGAPAAACKAIIAGAGGAAHLPGMLAAKTTVPVLGVPVASRHLQGVDSLHSIVQMPKGMPVATFAIGDGRRRQRGAVRRGHAGQRRPGAARAARRLPRRQTEAARAMTLPTRMSASRALPRHRPPRPPATLGVMGGGQLGRMFVHAAQAMGYFTAVLDPDPASPAGLVATTTSRPTTSTSRAWRS